METFEEFIHRKEEKPIRMKDVGRNGFYIFVKEAATYMQQHNLEDKYFVIERLRISAIEGEVAYKKEKVGDIQYRIGYYIVGKIGRGNNRWMWGQFCPMIPKEDFERLINKAKKEKTIL